MKFGQGIGPLLARVLVVATASALLVLPATGAQASLTAKKKPKGAKTTATTTTKGAQGSVDLSLTGAETASVKSVTPLCTLTPVAGGNAWSIKLNGNPAVDFRLDSAGKLIASATFAPPTTRLYGFANAMPPSVTLTGKTLTVNGLQLGLLGGAPNPAGNYVTMTGKVVCP